MLLFLVLFSLLVNLITLCLIIRDRRAFYAPATGTATAPVELFEEWKPAPAIDGDAWRRALPERSRI